MLERKVYMTRVSDSTWAAGWDSKRLIPRGPDQSNVTAMLYSEAHSLSRDITDHRDAIIATTLHLINSGYYDDINWHISMLPGFSRDAGLAHAWLGMQEIQR